MIIVKLNSPYHGHTARIALVAIFAVSVVKAPIDVVLPPPSSSRMMVTKFVKQTPQHIVLIHASTTQHPTAALTIMREKDGGVHGILCGLYEHCQSFYPDGVDGKDSGYP